jgi:hypothetical protein
MKKIRDYIDEGYTINKFERDKDLRSGDQICKIEMRALDGYINTITLDDNCTDEIEKQLFQYLQNKETQR